MIALSRRVLVLVTALAMGCMAANPTEDDFLEALSTDENLPAVLSPPPGFRIAGQLQLRLFDGEPVVTREPLRLQVADAQPNHPINIYGSVDGQTWNYIDSGMAASTSRISNVVLPDFPDLPNSAVGIVAVQFVGLDIYLSRPQLFSMVQGGPPDPDPQTCQGLGQCIYLRLDWDGSTIARHPDLRGVVHYSIYSDPVGWDAEWAFDVAEQIGSTSAGPYAQVLGPFRPGMTPATLGQTTVTAYREEITCDPFAYAESCVFDAAGWVTDAPTGVRAWVGDHIPGYTNVLWSQPCTISALLPTGGRELTGSCEAVWANEFYSTP